MLNLMNKILISFAILLFLAAGLKTASLYRLGEKAIEESIVEFNKLESSAYESTEEKKTPEIALNPVKPEAAVKLETEADSYTSQTWDKEDNPLALESAKETKDKVSKSEKELLTELLLSKLTAKDISELKGMLSNGITAEEKERAKTILYSRLTTEDLNILMEAYIKYTQHK